MTPKNAKAQEKAIEALIAASLRAPKKETELTHEEISRYVDQRVTLSQEDKVALEKSKGPEGDQSRSGSASKRARVHQRGGRGAQTKRDLVNTAAAVFLHPTTPASSSIPPSGSTGSRSPKSEDRSQKAEN